MHYRLQPASARVDRPAWAWLGIALELATAVGAIPVGLSMIGDPSGSSLGMSQSWIADSVFGSYLVPGIYLFVMNGLGMVVLAGLSVARHWTAPWLTGVLGTGLVIWIVVQLVAIPSMRSPLQVAFLAIGLVLGVIALAWLRRTDQLRLW